MIKVLEKEIRDVPNHEAERLLLGGVSTGCDLALAIYSRWPGPQPLGGVMCMLGMQAYDDR